ncbi:ABC transporter substrate-binding protein [Halobacteriovorax sp. GFR7]|uniref:ABC transporter substrate-binding protein n=2 Tax=Halobacteriovorax TaxID=1652133 RepID=UPI003716DDA9
MFKYISLILITLLVSCGGIQMINRDTSHLYTEKFLKDFDVAKKSFVDGNKELALGQLNAIQDAKLRPAELATKTNLIGVINYSNQNYEQAIFQFNLALNSSGEDGQLNAQIKLNLASSYYKLGDLENTFKTLDGTDSRWLLNRDLENFHKLRYRVSKELDFQAVALDSLLWLNSGANTVDELKEKKFYGQLVTQYFIVDQAERVRIVQDFKEGKDFVCAYLSYLEIEQLINQGNKGKAQEVGDWVKSQYNMYPEVIGLVTARFENLKKYSKINLRSIGVVLPLTGDKSKFGKRALAGIDHAVRKYNEQNSTKPNFQPIQIKIFDSMGSAIVGKEKVREMIERENSSIIIGGLLKDEAKAQYEAARKYGAFFISLSQIYTSKDDKGHLLIEVPGSVESQVSLLFSEKYLSKFGNKVSIIYPNTDTGYSYVDSAWKMAEKAGAEIVSIQSFDTNQTDHRSTVAKILGLYFTRERQEEFELLKSVHKLEGNTSIRRVQTLGPIVDFDWVLLPAAPNDALQLIPSFNYYDAFNVNLVGGPNWRSRRISRETSKLGKLFFVDSEVPQGDSGFVSSYQSRYGQRPGVVEILGFEGMALAANVLSLGDFTSRDELERTLVNAKKVAGITGSWRLEDDVWMKDMSLMSLYRGRLNKVNLTIEKSVEKSIEEEVSN